MSVDVSTAPLFLNANSGVYTAQALRQPLGDLLCAGVLDDGSFVVQPRVAGANMSVDVATAGDVNIAYVLGTVVDDQGAYRVAYTGAALNLVVADNASGNPRLDQVVLVVGDSQHAGAIDKAYLDIVAGTPTAGATLDNRSGVGALPDNAILLSDVLVDSGASSITAGALRDKRPRAVVGRGKIPAGDAGDIKATARATAPAGWLECDGAAVARNDYPDLFAAIGETWGAGDGSTTFNLPDLRGRVMVGAGAGNLLTPRSVAEYGGEEAHTLTKNEMPAHNHTAQTTNNGDHTHPTTIGNLHKTVASQSFNSPGGTALFLPGEIGAGATIAASAGAHQHGIPSDGGGAAHPNMQPYAACLHIIKT